MKLKDISSDEFRLLEVLYDNSSINSSDERICLLNQIEMSKMIRKSKQNTNNLVRMLKDKGIIKLQSNNKSVYLLNPIASVIIAKMREDLEIR